MIRFVIDMKTTLKIILVLLILSPLAGCEDNMFLRSKKKMKEELQGTWKKNHLGNNPSFVCNIAPNNSTEFFVQEYWIFKDDRLYTVYDYSTSPTCGFTYPDIGTPDLSLDTLASGQYVHFDNSDTNVVAGFSIDTDVFKAFLNLEFISGNNDTLVSDNNLVPEWEFVELEDNRLYIAADNASGNTVLQMEFYKVK